MLQLNRVKAVEKEKDELEEARNEAVEFLTLENAIVRLKNKLYQKYMYVSQPKFCCGVITCQNCTVKKKQMDSSSYQGLPRLRLGLHSRSYIYSLELI